jgi:stage V sporulation protein SpoVS
MAEGEIIQVGKNIKVSVLSQRLVQRVLEQGWIELEAIGAEVVNHAVKTVTQARQALETEGYALIIPILVEVPLEPDSPIVANYNK